MTTYSIYVNGRLLDTLFSLRLAQMEACRAAKKGKVKVTMNYPSGKTEDITAELIETGVRA
jgi:hypothetical protein